MSDETKPVPPSTARYQRRRAGQQGALELWTLGLGVADIATELDTKPEVAARWLSEAVARVPAHTSAELRALQEIRLDQLTGVLLPMVTGDTGDVEQSRLEAAKAQMRAALNPPTHADTHADTMVKIEAAKVVLEIERHRAALYGLTVADVRV